MMMSGKRNLDEIDSVMRCGQLMQTRRQQRPLKKMKSISDEIAPLLNQFSFQMSQDNGEIEEVVESSFAELAEGGVAAELAEGFDGSSESFTLSTENGHNGEDNSDVAEKESVKTGDDGHEFENGASDGVTEVDGIKKFMNSASRQVTSLGDSIGRTANHIFDVLRHSNSVEGPPGNNVYVPHPTGGVMIPLGMHIKPIDDDVGHEVLMIEQGKLAEQTELKKNDVLIAIEDRCIKKSSFEEVIKLFGTVSQTFSITIMRRRNTDEVDGDEISEFLYITMTMEISTDNDVVSIIVIDIKATPYRYEQTVKDKLIISQKTGAKELRRFLKINGNKTVTMEPQYVGEECQFTMNTYFANDSGPATVCTLCNATNSNALTAQKQAKDKDFKITLGNADDLTSTKIVPDSRFFYFISTGVTNEHAFESIQRKDHYLTFENGDVIVKHQSVKDAKFLNSAFRFTVCGEECEGAIDKNPKQQLAGKPNPQKPK